MVAIKTSTLVILSYGFSNEKSAIRFDAKYFTHTIDLCNPNVKTNTGDAHNTYIFMS